MQNGSDDKRNPFDFVTSILQSNTHLDDLEGYNQFLTNRALSYNPDTISQATIGNVSQIDDDQHYDLMFYAVRKYKRPRSPWAKAAVNPDVKLLCEYYNVSRKKAEQMLRTHTEEQLNNIRTAQGGDIKKK